MLWRRRSEGFEWHKYVRTTIKLRRRDRRQRVARARQAVVGGLKEAGQIAAEGLKDAGHIAAAGLKDAGRAGVVAGASGLAAARRWSLAGLRATAAVLVWVVDKVSRTAAFMLSSFLIPAGRWMQARLAPLSATIHRLGYAEPLLVLAVALLAIGLAHARAEGLDDKGVAVTGLGLVLLA
ncbi:MAG TPA: hypothetical protein VNK52_10490, partial [Hyphomicrobiaceae bacterium]|nr:hypothetical protein [Hyphomicrobiaceae bacterium]